MRLATISASLTLPGASDLINALYVVGIRTVPNLIFSQTPSSLWHLLGDPNISLQQLEDLQKNVIQLVAAPGVDGNRDLEIEDLLASKAAPAKVGLSDLDDVLGGLLPGEIVEITGTQMSGKTLLSLHIVLDHLLHHPDASAFWIDPDSSFRSDRAFEILSYMGHLDAHSVLARLSVTFCPTASSAVLATDQLRRSIESGGTRQLRFIVIDTITAIFSPLINGTTSQGLAILVSFVRQLSILAKTHGLTILLTNTATPTHLRTIPHKFPSRAFNLALLLTRSLTSTFGYMADTTLALSRTDSIAGADDNSDDAWGWRPENVQAEKEGKKIHVAQILRSRRMAAGKWCTFAVRHGLTLEEFRIPELSGSGSGEPSFTAEAEVSSANTNTNTNTTSKGKNRSLNAFGSRP